jgi:serine/threonine-protein kinase
MMPELERGRWDRIATVFSRVVQAPDAERTALIDQLCGSDETIRLEVQAMLAAHAQPGLIAERRFVYDSHVDTGRLPDGIHVGPYRIEALVGAGGMGDVYRAVRADGVHRHTVALKVLRQGYRTSEMLRRFRVEREALARLVHPGIATILDGGALADGRPYIVLQFVDGVPVTTYCASHELSLHDRLALFVRIATAVQFAHGRLVVHRDLKPSNIFVDADGSPRLLDFGIAKLLDVDDDATLGAPSAPELRLFTPDYAAPEQFLGEAPTTATDVYALGVLLFELLTGKRPFSFSAGGNPISRVERAVLHDTPPAPSSIMASPTDARRLRGDLDTIVLTALRKEPERRYASAGQLAEDVNRHLTGRPVMAVADSVAYRVGKFIRRNSALVVGGVVTVSLVTAFAITSTVQARRIARERDRAEQERAGAEEVLRILTGLFERGNPNTHPGGDTLRVTSLLDSAELAVSTLGTDPVRQTALWRAVGRMRMARGEYARGLRLLTNAYELRRKTFGVKDIEAARIHHEIAVGVAAYRGERLARPMLDSSFHELESLLGERDEEVHVALNDLLDATLDSTAARPLLARLVSLERTWPSKNPIAIAEELNRQGAEHVSARRYGEAAALFQATLDIVRRQLPPEHEDVRTVSRNLAAAYYMDGKLAQAESMQRAAVALETRLNASAVSRGMAHEALALTLFAAHHPDSAEAEEQSALEALRSGAAPENWRIWSAQRNLAFMAGARGRLTDALVLLDSAIELSRKGADSNGSAGYLMAQRVPFLLRLGRVREAAQGVAEAERRLGSSPAVSVPHRADVNRYAGMVAYASDDAETAARRFGAAVALVEPPGKAETVPDLGTCLLGVSMARLGRYDEARPMLDAGCRRYERGMTDPLIMQWVESARRSVAR